MRNVYYNRDELNDTTRQSISSLNNCCDKMNEVQSLCVEDNNSCSEKLREISDRQAECYTLNGELSAVLSKLTAQEASLVKQIASLREPRVVNGPNGPELDDPDGPKRERLYAELDKVQSKIAITKDLMDELASTQSLMEESTQLMNKYPDKFANLSSKAGEQISDMQSSCNTISRTSNYASSIFDRIASVRFIRPVDTPYGDAYICTNNVDGNVDMDNFDSTQALFKKYTDNMVQDCEMLRKYTQSITDWNDKLRVEAEKILADIQKIIEKFILVSMQQCFNNLDTLNECYRDYNNLNSKLIF